MPESKQMEKGATVKPLNPETERAAARRARDKANAARWSLEVAVFLFAVLIIVIILLFDGFGVEIVGSTALVGLGLVWLIGWRQGKRLYQRFYDEELETMQQTQRDITAVEETIEEQVQKAFRQRWK
ncbi:MAG: hypothetical protein Q7J73_04845 [Dehalococcoidales bacterium]|nr:hypothetical protein [Dehalococcoidales bacterium]